MGLKKAVVAVAALLLLPGCAPETMAPDTLREERQSTAAAQDATASSGGVPDEESAAAEALNSGGDEPTMSTAESSSEMTSAQSSGSAMAWSSPEQQPTNGWVEVPIHNVAYSELGRLEAVSPTFRDYAEAAMSAADTDGCSVLGMSTMSMHPVGFILGTISTDCGGGQAIWAEQEDGQWRLVKLLQAAPACTELEELGLPIGVGLVCTEGDGELADF